VTLDAFREQVGIDDDETSIHGLIATRARAALRTLTPREHVTSRRAT
jgi:hypothetical protein